MHVVEGKFAALYRTVQMREIRVELFMMASSSIKIDP